jgi:cullin 3
MVIYSSGAMLYNGVNQLVAENLDKLANEEIVPKFPSRSFDPTQQSQEAEMLLKALKHVWDDHLGNMLKLSQVLKYMVRPT